MDRKIGQGPDHHKRVVNEGESRGRHVAEDDRRCVYWVYGECRNWREEQLGHYHDDNS